MLSAAALTWRGAVADQGSVSRLLDALRAGDPAALEALWGKLFPRVASLARQKFAGQHVLRSQDEEVAASVMTNLWEAAAGQRLDGVRDRDDLWRLLLVVTLRKVSHRVRDEKRQKRGGLWHRLGLTGRGDGTPLDLTSPEMSPELAAMMAEECRRRIDMLPDQALRTLAALRAEGFSVEEIGVKMGCSRRSVTRKLALIRSIWLRDQAP